MQSCCIYTNVSEHRANFPLSNCIPKIASTEKTKTDTHMTLKTGRTDPMTVASIIRKPGERASSLIVHTCACEKVCECIHVYVEVCTQNKFILLYITTGANI